MGWRRTKGDEGHIRKVKRLTESWSQVPEGGKEAGSGEVGRGERNSFKKAESFGKGISWGGKLGAP